VNKINWAQKLTSRKFWAAIIGFVTALLVAFKVDTLTAEQVVSVISACSVLIAYIIGEGMVDTTRVITPEIKEPTNWKGSIHDGE
jgi:uncharacterized membrane protein